MKCYGISESSFPLSNYLEYILLKIGEESVYSFPKTCSTLSLFLRHILLMEAWFFILFVCLFFNNMLCFPSGTYDNKTKNDEGGPSALLFEEGFMDSVAPKGLFEHMLSFLSLELLNISETQKYEHISSPKYFILYYIFSFWTQHLIIAYISEFHTENNWERIRIYLSPIT